jgi:hypothetical protein
MSGAGARAAVGAAVRLSPRERDCSGPARFPPLRNASASGHRLGSSGSASAPAATGSGIIPPVLEQQPVLEQLGLLAPIERFSPTLGWSGGRPSRALKPAGECLERAAEALVRWARA